MLKPNANKSKGFIFERLAMYCFNEDELAFHEFRYLRVLISKDVIANQRPPLKSFLLSKWACQISFCTYNTDQFSLTIKKDNDKAKKTI